MKKRILKEMLVAMPFLILWGAIWGTLVYLNMSQQAFISYLIGCVTALFIIYWIELRKAKRAEK